MKFAFRNSVKAGNRKPGVVNQIQDGSQKDGHVTSNETCEHAVPPRATATTRCAGADWRRGVSDGVHYSSNSRLSVFHSE